MSSNSETSLLADDPAQSSAPSKKRSRPSSPDPQPASLRQRLPSPDHGLAHQTSNSLLAGSLPDARHGSSSSSSSSSFQDRAADLSKRIAETEKKIEEAEDEIKKVGKQIDDVEVEIKNESDREERKQLREEKRQLREKERQLGEKEIKLLDRVKDLRTALLQLNQSTSPSSSPPSSQPPTVIPFDVQHIHARVESSIKATHERLRMLASKVFPFLVPYQSTPGGRCFFERFFSDDYPHPLVSGLPDPAAGLTNDYLFQQISASKNRVSILLDVSGSGKTRHMYEALCLRFGFYFVGNSFDNGGSADLKRLSKEILTLHSFHPERVDRKFVEFQFMVLVYYRWLTYCRIREYFNGSLSPKQWLLMQAYPLKIFGEDIFADFAPCLMEFPSEAFRHLSKIPSGTPLFLDEAQSLPTDPIFPAFASEQANKTVRTILSPLVSAIHELTSLRMIIAGTGLSLALIPEITSVLAGSDKSPSREIRNLGGFDTRQQIAACLRTFLFEHLAENEEALQYLFDRVRGRARFLVTVLTRLKQQETHDLETLKKVCRGFVEEITTSSVRSLTSGICMLHAGDLPRPARLPPAQIERLKEYHPYFYDLSQLVFHFRYYSLPKAPPTGAADELLEHALCRFAKVPGSSSVSIDEPLVVLAYIRCIESRTSQSLLHYNIINAPTSSAKGAWYEFYMLWPVLRWLSGISLTEFDKHLIKESAPAVLTELFAMPQQPLPAQGAASSNSVPFSHVLSLPFTVDHFNPLDEPACLSEVNRSEDSYDILEYFQRGDRPPAFYPHCRAGPDCVMILRFESRPAENTPKEVYMVPLTIAFKSGRPSSIKTELENLNPLKFYATGPKEKSSMVDTLNERRTQLNEYIRKTFEGRWLGLLIMGGEALLENHCHVATSGMAFATTLHQFLPAEIAAIISKIEHHKVREGSLSRSNQRAT